jgi:lipid A 3-O-deacylase
MKKLGLLISVLLYSANVFAVDGVSVEFGNGNSTDLVRLGVISNWEKQWPVSENWQFAGFWEASLGSWRGHSANGNNQVITDLGLTPVFRLQQKNMSGFAPYAEGAIGFHLVSPTFINADRKFGSSFEFGDHVGAGVRFGAQQQFDLGYRFQHLSNGSIKKPNQGINFNQIHLAYRF